MTKKVSIFSYIYYLSLLHSLRSFSRSSHVRYATLWSFLFSVCMLNCWYERYCITMVMVGYYITSVVVVCTTIDFFSRSALFVQNQPPPGRLFLCKKCPIIDIIGHFLLFLASSPGEGWYPIEEVGFNALKQ